MARQKDNIRLDRLLYIVDLIVNSENNRDIVEKTVEKFGIGLPTAGKDLEKARKLLQGKTNRNEEYNYNIIIARYDSLYRDCEQIENVQSRIQEKRRITEARAKVTGVEAHKNIQAQTVNILNYFPDQEILKKYSAPEVVEIQPQTAQESRRKALPRGKGFRAGNMNHKLYSPMCRESHQRFSAQDCRLT